VREGLDRWVRGHPVAIDAALVFCLLVFPGLPTLTMVAGSWQEAVGIVALLTVPLAWRRSNPALATGVVFATAFLHFVAGAGLLASDLTVFVALYSVAAYGTRLVSLLGLAFALVGAGMVALWAVFNDSGGDALLIGPLVSAIGGGFVLAVWAAGSLRSTRRAYLDAILDRANRLEIEREQQAQLGAAAERARIARELHDVVAHSLSVIIAQADGGRYAARGDPTAAAEALEVVAATGRTALTDMRRLLGVLREGDGPQHGPQPGFDTIADLVASVRGSGLPVSYATVGHPRPMGDAMGLAAYRIVQEALTNVLKHAGPAARAAVQIVWEPESIRLTIDDDGRGAAVTTDGHGQGVGGMRERARLYGGRVEASPRHGGGYRVQAVLPYPGAALPTVWPQAPIRPDDRPPPQPGQPQPPDPVAEPTEAHEVRNG
jgi:signal transduction histidine kinase